jgi:hypothetical protein
VTTRAASYCGLTRLRYDPHGLTRMPKLLAKDVATILFRVISGGAELIGCATMSVCTACCSLASRADLKRVPVEVRRQCGKPLMQ